MNTNEFMKHLANLNACNDVKEWATNKSWREVYDTCHRGDWLLWLYRKSKGYDFQRLTLAKGCCANTVRHLMKDERSLKATDAAIAFGKGEISRHELSVTVVAAYAAARVASSVDTVAATLAAYAAYAAAARGADAAYVADVAVRGAVAAARGADVRKENQQKTADIVREVLPFEIWEF